MRRVIGVVTMGALVVASLAALAGPVAARNGARTAVRNTRFCSVLGSGDFNVQAFNPDSAEFATQQIDKLLATHPPSKVKKALKSIRKFYNALVDANSSTPAIPTRSVLQAFRTFSNYVVSNCRSATTTTT